MKGWDFMNIVKILLERTKQSVIWRTITPQEFVEGTYLKRTKETIAREKLMKEIKGAE